MIQVNEVRRDGGWELVFSGHAGYSQGEDIVCAAVSILFFTLAEAVSRGGGGASFRSGQGGCLCRRGMSGSAPLCGGGFCFWRKGIRGM